MDVAQKLARASCDPILGMATIAMNELPCGVCRGSGKSFYKLPPEFHASDCTKVLDDQGLCPCQGIGTRVCESCFGTLYEACSPEIRGKMYAELAHYVHSKRAQLNHTTSDGSMRPIWVVNVAQEVKQPQAIDTKAHPRVLDVPKDDNVQ